MIFASLAGAKSWVRAASLVTMLGLSTTAYARVDAGAGPTCDTGSGAFSFTGPVSASFTNGDQHGEAAAIPAHYLYAEGNAYGSGIPCKWGGGASDNETLHVIGLHFNQLVTLNVSVSFNSSLYAYSNVINSWSDSNVNADLGAGIWGSRTSEDFTLLNGVEYHTSGPHTLNTDFVTSEWGNVFFGIGAQAWGTTGSGAVTSITAGSPHGTLFRIRLAGDSRSVTGLSYQLGDGPVFVLSAAVPEPQAWSMLIAGFGICGGAMRRRRTIAA